jgi:N-acetylglutamate synthase-like GNAT family acetyltransferase
MKTRRAQIGDAAEACLIIRRSITELCSLDHGGDEKLLADWLSNKTTENVTKWILQSHFFVADEAGTILGVAAMDNAGKITLNYVSPDARFRGVSRALVLCMEDQARALGIEECSLDTTQTALQFYQGMGYAISKQSYKLALTGTPATVLTKRLRREKL